MSKQKRLRSSDLRRAIKTSIHCWKCCSHLNWLIDSHWNCQGYDDILQVINLLDWRGLFLNWSKNPISRAWKPPQNVPVAWHIIRRLFVAWRAINWNGQSAGGVYSPELWLAIASWITGHEQRRQDRLWWIYQRGCQPGKTTVQAKLRDSL